MAAVSLKMMRAIWLRLMGAVVVLACFHLVYSLLLLYYHQYDSKNL